MKNYHKKSTGNTTELSQKEVKDIQQKHYGMMLGAQFDMKVSKFTRCQTRPDGMKCQVIKTCEMQEETIQLACGLFPGDKYSKEERKVMRKLLDSAGYTVLKGHKVLGQHVPFSVFEGTTNAKTYRRIAEKTAEFKCAVL